jgi:hypothetical protein
VSLLCIPCARTVQQRLGELDMAIRRTRADNRLGLESLRDVVEGVRRLMMVVSGRG